MRRTIKNVLMICFVLTLILIKNDHLSVAMASTGGYSQADAVAWAKSQEGVSYGECVFLVKAYYERLGQSTPYGNAYEYLDGAKQHVPDGWTYQSYPQPGDIAVWDRNVPANPGWTTDKWGHVGIVIEVSGSNILTIESNINGPKAEYSDPDKRPISGVTKFIRPDFVNNTRKEVLSGVYVIHSAWDDNVCLDIQGDSKENNANIQLYQRVYNDVQKFRIIRWNDGYYCIKSIHNGRWLDAKTPIGNNSNVKLYDTNDDDEDFWYFEDAGNGYVYIKNKTGYYLDVQGDNAVNNANIQLYQFAGNNSQRWRLEDVTSYYSLENGTYMVHSAIDNDYVFDISGNSIENRANIQLYKQEDTTVQYYQFTKKGNYYVVRSVYADKWLDIRTPIGNNSNLQLWESNDSAEEHWVLEDAGNGYVFIRSNADYYIDVQGDQAKNNANVQVYRFAGNDSQKWLLKKVEHKVSYNGNGGSGEPAAQIKAYNTELVLSDVIPTNSGQAFEGWNTEADGSGTRYKPGDKYILDENVTLYAIWAAPDFFLPSDLRAVEESAFKGCAFTFVVIPKGAKSISDYAFAKCDNLRHIFIPDSVFEISNNAFEGVTGLTIHGVKGSVAEMYANNNGFAFMAG